MRPLSLDQVLACPNLPTLPKVASEVLEMTRDPDVKLADLAGIVQYDQALCGRILRTVNSCYFRLSTPCSTISRAMAYLGLKAVKALVLNFSLVDVARRTGGHGFDLLSYWRRCVYSAAAARSVAQLTAFCDPEEASIAALMQDIGMLAIHSALPGPYEKLVASIRGDHRMLVQREKQLFSFTHAAAGAGLGERWKLPAQITEPIRHHHDATVETTASHANIIQAVRLGSHLAMFFAFDGGREELNRVYGLGDSVFNLTRTEVKTLVRESAQHARNLAELLTVDIGCHPNIEAILAQAEDARIDQALALQRDADHLKQTNQHLARQALSDALTGTANRRCFDTELQSSMQKAHFDRQHVALIMVDIDSFKSLNDDHGHQAGDGVLAEVARRLIEQVGNDGLVCRYGGEEFAIIVPDANRRRAALLAEDLRLAIASRPIHPTRAALGAGALEVTVSLGVAAYEPECSPFAARGEHLITAADQALYAAKQSGRNCVRVFQPRDARQQPSTRAGAPDN